MRSPFNFIVRPYNGRRYDNIKKIGGIDFITSSSQEDHTVSNRYATVVATPINYKGEIEPGDTIMVHHNVFKYFYDMKGRQRSGKSFLKDDLFLVDDYQYYLYKHNNIWKAEDRFCFVTPVPKEEFYLEIPGVEQPLVGVIKYTNNKLLSYGIDVGDRVSFRPDAEYAVMLEGEKVYRVSSDWITIKI